MVFSVDSLIHIASLMFLPMFVALTGEEVCRGYVAYFLGDKTARDQGLLTPNLCHRIDFMGTIIVPICMLFFMGVTSALLPWMGWVKPIPINQDHLKGGKLGIVFLTLTSPLYFCFLTLVSGVLVTILLNFWGVGTFVVDMVIFSINIDCMFLFFCFLPILPFPAGRLIYHFLPKSWAKIYVYSEVCGLIVIFILILFDRFAGFRIVQYFMFPFYKTFVFFVKNLFSL